MKQLLVITLFIMFAITAKSQDAQTSTTTTTATDKSLARVEQMQGLYVFVDSKPVAEYLYLGSVKGAGGGAGWNPQYNPIRDRMIKKVKEDYPQANGIILHLNHSGKDQADAILIK